MDWLEPRVWHAGGGACGAGHSSWWWWGESLTAAIGVMAARRMVGQALTGQGAAMSTQCHPRVPLPGVGNTQLAVMAMGGDPCPGIVPLHPGHKMGDPYLLPGKTFV